MTYSLPWNTPETFLAAQQPRITAAFPHPKPTETESLPPASVSLLSFYWCICFKLLCFFASTLVIFSRYLPNNELRYKMDTEVQRVSLFLIGGIRNKGHFILIAEFCRAMILKQIIFCPLPDSSNKNSGCIFTLNTKCQRLLSLLKILVIIGNNKSVFDAILR